MKNTGYLNRQHDMGSYNQPPITQDIQVSGSSNPNNQGSGGNINMNPILVSNQMNIQGSESKIPGRIFKRKK